MNISEECVAGASIIRHLQPPAPSKRQGDDEASCSGDVLNRLGPWMFGRLSRSAECSSCPALAFFLWPEFQTATDPLQTSRSDNDLICFSCYSYTAFVLCDPTFVPRSWYCRHSLAESAKFCERNPSFQSRSLFLLTSSCRSIYRPYLGQGFNTKILSQSTAQSQICLWFEAVFVTICRSLQGLSQAHRCEKGGTPTMTLPRDGHATMILRAAPTQTSPGRPHDDRGNKLSYNQTCLMLHRMALSTINPQSSAENVA